MIYFTSVRWKNFLSTGNNMTEVFLSRSPTTLIIGENGAGKSTILDALCFGLFGKPFRNINKPQLINSINEKQSLVEIDFEVGSKKYIIKRGIKPNVFEILCDGELLNQSSHVRDYQEYLEKTILKLNYKSFTQIVILGNSTFVPFMQLKASDRREIIEELLDIKVFSTMNTLLKQRVAENKNEIQSTENDIELTESKIKIHKEYVESLRQNNDELIEEKTIQYNELLKLREEYLKNIKTLEYDVNHLLSHISDKDKVEATYKKLDIFESKIEDNIKKTQKEIKFFKDNNDCPTCKQHIDEIFRENEIQSKEQKMKEQTNALTEIEQKIKESQLRISEIDVLQKQIQQKQTEIVKCTTHVSSLDKQMIQLEKEKHQLNIKKNESLSDNNEEIKELNKSIKKLNDDVKKLYVEKDLYSVANNLLKDTGIKTKIIKQYLPIMNKLINKYLAEMDFFVSFNLDESFNESIKSRYRDDFSYTSFSEGEKSRIDLALLLTWRAIAKIKNSASTNLLIFDEVFDSSLDSSGTDDLLKILQSLSDMTNIFVISHKGDVLYDKFRSIIKFEKKNSFSRIAQ